MKTFNRRVMLRGLGGAAVAAPFLPSVAEREAKAQGMTATAPKRLIVFYTHYGCLTTPVVPEAVAWRADHGRLHGHEHAQADGALREQAADGSRPPVHERVEQRGLEWSEERSPHSGPGVVLHVPPGDPERRQRLRHVRSIGRQPEDGGQADRTVAGSRLRRAGERRRRGSAFRGDRRRERHHLEHHAHPLVGPAHASLPGCDLADGALQHPHGAVRRQPVDTECGHLQGCEREEHHRLRPRRPEPVQGPQDEQRRPEEGQRLDGAPALRDDRDGRRGRAVHDGHGHQPEPSSI